MEDDLLVFEFNDSQLIEQYLSQVTLLNNEYTELNIEKKKYNQEFKTKLIEYLKKNCDENCKPENRNVNIGFNADSSEDPQLDDYFNEKEKLKELFLSDNSSLCKKLYHQLSLKTHPDKIKDPHINKYFNIVKDSFDKNMLFKLLLICKKLEISLPKITRKDIHKIKNEISWIQSSITIMRKQYPYQWKNKETDEEKEALLLEFIKETMGL